MPSSAFWRPLIGAAIGLGLLASCGSASPAPDPRAARTTQALRRGQEQLEWFRIRPPTVRRHGGMIYDAARQHLVVAFGETTTGVLRDVWERDAKLGWHERTPALGGPVGRADFGLAYDTQRQRTVLFGGRNFSAAPFRELWEWDGFVWTARDVPGGPSARSAVAQAYDAARGETLVFGGFTDARTVSRELWGWNGSAWVDHGSAAGPSARRDAAMTYDAGRSKIVLFGGRLEDGTESAETWEWDGVAWTLATAPGPAKRVDAAMTHDPERARVVLFGGASNAIQLADVWEWDGATWQERTPAEGPSTRQGAQLAYDAQAHAVTLVGGAHDATPLEDVWTWNGTAWTRVLDVFVEPPARQNPVLSYTSNEDRLLLFGGLAAKPGGLDVRGDTWARTPSGWVQDARTPSPSPRALGGVAYDSAHARTMLVGGALYHDDFTVEAIRDTWLYEGSGWTDVTPAAGPDAAIAPALGYDPRRDRFVLFGGRLLTDYASRTWEWENDTWVDHTPAAGGPVGRALGSFAYDASSHALLFFGGTALSGMLNDLWSWDGTTWTELGAGAGPQPPKANAMLIPSVERGSTLLLASAAAETYASKLEVWEWADQRWEHLPTVRPAVQVHDYGAAAFAPNAAVYGGDDLSIASNVSTLVVRGAPCTNDAEATTGFCVDGVSCVSRGCAACETCADPTDSGRCMPVRLAEDPDSCGAAQGSTCDSSGACKLALGSAAQAPTDCASGFVTDGVCCDVASCGSCRTCNAAEKQIADNTGHCGTRQAGTDPHDDCAETPATSCGDDGTCDGFGLCRKHVSGTACGAVSTDGRVTSQVCSGGGECLSVEASCDGDHTLLVQGGQPIDCGAYGCEGASCKASCTSIGDCASGYFCNDDRTCSAPTAAPPKEDGGCSCDTGGSGASPGSLSLIVLVALFVARRRRVLAHVPGVLALAACTAASAPPKADTSAAALGTGETLRWSNLGTPSPRYDAMMTYDAANRSLLLFGGTNGGLAYTDFFREQWQYDGPSWLDTTPPSGPAQRSAGSIAYDRIHQRALLFLGGIGPQFGGAAQSDFWLWNGSAWSAAPSKDPLPSLRYYPALAYDEARDRLVMFGGSVSGINGETWEWDGITWTQRTPATTPSPRTGAKLVYDPVRKVDVLFGGYDLTTYFDETWEWDGATWTLATGARPPGRWVPGMTYDQDRSKIVMAFGRNSVVLADTWERDAEGTWTERTPTAAPPARATAAFAYDEARHRTVLFGGIDASAALGDTWEWDGTSWLEIGSAIPTAVHDSFGFSHDAAAARTLLFGGQGAPGTDVRGLWSFDGHRWSELTADDTPSARRSVGMATDGASRTLVFGGFAGSTRLRETWQWDGAAWSERTPPAGGPSARSTSPLAYDAARDRFVLFGGQGDADVLGDTWEWDGATWTEQQPAHRPAARQQHVLVYDADRHVTVLFGGSDAGGVKSREIWEWNGSDWTDRTQPNAGPGAPAFAAGTYDAAVHRTTFVITPGAVFGTSSDVWGWDGTTWSTIPTENPPPFVASFGLTYDLANRSALGFGQMERGAGLATELWILRGRGASCTSDAEATTGHCVDGVACEAASCPGTCESCNVAGSAGRCAPVLLATDPDTCGGAQICDATGACRGALGQPASAPSDCASGFVVDGVCCETASCGLCATCSAAQKAISDNDGRCGAARAGLDLRDECAATAPDTCGDDGTCDGRGACAKHANGTVCGKDAVCTGAGACVVQTAVCEGEGAVRAPSGKVASCAGFRCQDGACKSRCDSLDDCVDGSVCDQSGRCVSGANLTEDGEGCSCRVTGAGSRAPYFALLALALLFRRAKRIPGAAQKRFFS